MTISLIRRRLASIFAVAICSLSFSPAFAQINWTEPELVFSNDQESFQNARPGIDVAADENGNAMAIWMQNGTASDKSVVIVSASSTDFGASWASVRLVTSPGVGNIPGDIDIAYAGSGKWVAFWVIERADYVAEFYTASSINMGQSWSAAELITTETVRYITSSSPLPHPMEIASDGKGTVIATYRSALLTSRDSGITWTFTPGPKTRTDNDLPEQDRWSRICFAGGQIWYHAIQRHHLLIGSILKETIYTSYSTDNGKTWSVPTRIEGRDYLNLIDVDGFGSNAAVAMTVNLPASPDNDQERLVASTSDFGSNWTVTPVGDQGAIIGVAVSSGAKVVLTATSNAIKMVKSTDDGEFWTPPVDLYSRQGSLEDVLFVSGETLLTAIEAVETSPYLREIGTIQFTTEGAVEATDVVSSETRLPWRGHNIRFPAIAASPNGRMIAAWVSEAINYEKRILYSITDDFGHTWSKARLMARITPYDHPYPVDPPYIMHVGKNKWVAWWNDGFYAAALTQSIDNGDSWARPRTVQTDVYEYEIWGGNESGTLLGRARNAATYYYIRSDNLGSDIGYAPGADFGAAVLSLGSQEWLKIDDGHAFFSADNAHTWTARGRLPGAENATAVSIAQSADGSTIIVAVSVGPSTPFVIYRSTDSGHTWEMFNVSVQGKYDEIGISVASITSDAWILSYGNSRKIHGETWFSSYSVDGGKSWSMFGVGHRNLAASHDRAVAVIQVYGDSTRPEGIYSSRAIIDGFTSAADWNLYQ